MRASLAAAFVLASLSASACTVGKADAGGEDAGAGGAAGSAGSAGSGGEAGTAPDAAVDPCGAVTVGGACQDPQHIEHCVVPDDPGPDGTAAPTVVVTTCPSPTSCSVVDGKAGCTVSTACQDGESLCPTPNAVAVCVSGDWQTTDCGTAPCLQKPGYGAVCAPQAGGATVATLTGTLLYEYRPMKADKSGFDALEQTPAQSLVAIVYDDTTFIGSGYTNGDGSFAIPIDQAPTANTNIFFFPMLFDDKGRIETAVAKWAPDPGTGPLASDGYWSFGIPTGGVADVGTFVVSEAQGSGAINIFEHVVFGLQTARALEPQIEPKSVLALWAPGEKHDCGTCYMNAAWGGATVTYGSGADHFDTAIPYQATDDTPMEWSSSVILHELGHYMMDAYSTTPGAGGTHTVTKLEQPGQAWSEGWASYFGQSSLGSGLYFAKQSNTSWWFEIDQFDKNYLGVPLPDPSAPMTQDLGEIFVATALWHLWSPADPSVEPDAWDTVGIGSQRVWDALVSPHLKSSALYSTRGYDTTDLVDWLDAVQCAGTLNADIDAVLSHYGFPYDHAAPCP